MEDTIAQNSTSEETRLRARLIPVPVSCLPQTSQFISRSSSAFHLTCLCRTVSSFLSYLSRAVPHDSTSRKKCGAAHQRRLTGCPPLTKKSQRVIITLVGQKINWGRTEGI